MQRFDNRLSIIQSIYFQLYFCMKQILIVLSFFFLLIERSTCVLGVDVSQLFSKSVYDCLKKDGYHFVIIRGYCSFGGIDHNANQGLTNAKQAGLQTEIYMFPCRGKSATAQVDEMVAGIHTSLYSKVWIDVESNPSTGCSWSGHDAASNCKFVQQLIARIKSHGKTPAIYGSAVMWQNIFGSRGACTSASGQQLWYAHYDNSASFSDYTEFGGWKKPFMKQYQGNVNVCGAGVDKNFRQ